MEPDVEHRALFAPSVRAPGDQGVGRQFQGAEEDEGLRQAGGRKEEKGRQEEDQAAQDRQARRPPQAIRAQGRSHHQLGWADAAETAYLRESGAAGLTASIAPTAHRTTSTDTLDCCSTRMALVPTR